MLFILKIVSNSKNISKIFFIWIREGTAQWVNIKEHCTLIKQICENEEIYELIIDKTSLGAPLGIKLPWKAEVINLFSMEI